jgi:O-antigen/teichoic acid export membrane protein
VRSAAPSGLSVLAVANVTAAAIGFAQSLVVVRTLDLAGYGVLAIMASIVAVAVNLLDVRISDLASRLYYRSPEVGSGAVTSRQEVIAGALAVQGIVGIAISALSGAALLVFLALGHAGSPAAAALLLYACGEGLLLPLANLLTLAQRLRERFGVMAGAQVVNAALRAAIVLGALALRPDVTGAAYGSAAAAAASLLLHLGVTLWLWAGDGSLRGIRPRVALATYWRERRTLLALGLVNYQNLLHRAADALVVGSVAGASAAGLYRFARNCTDALYVVLFEASNKVYQPLLLRLLAAEQAAEFRRNAGVLVRAAAVLVVAGLAFEAVALDGLVAWTVGPRFLPATAAIMLLTAPVFFVLGLGLWIWPVLVHQQRVESFVGCSFVAVLVGQYAVPLLGIQLAGGSAVTWFALGYLLYYVILYAALLPRVYGMHPEAMPPLFAPAARRAV